MTEMLGIYTTKLYKLLRDAQGNTYVELRDWFDGKVEYQGYTNGLYENPDKHDKFKDAKVYSFTVDEDTLIVHIIN